MEGRGPRSIRSLDMTDASDGQRARRVSIASVSEGLVTTARARDVLRMPAVASR